MFLTRHFLHSPAAAPPLRIGVLLDGDYLPKPFADVLESVQASNYAELVLRVYNASAATQAPAGQRSPFPVRVARLLLSSRRRRFLLWSLYNKLDSRFAAAERDLFRPVDVSARLADVSRIDVSPIAKGFTHRFPRDAVQKIRQHDLDILLRFGFNIIHGEVLKAARYGVWSYHHGDNDRYRGGPAHFWELVEHNPLSGVMLQILTEDLDAGHVLCKGLAATENTLLVSKNRVRPYLLGATFALRKMFELHRGGFSELQAKAVPAAPYEGKRKLYRSPTNAQLARFLIPPLIGKAVARPLRREMYHHWQIAFRVGRPHRFAEGASFDVAGFRWFDSPRGRFYADPFLFEKDGTVCCFFEDFDYSSERGRISCGKVSPDGDLTEIEPVLEPGYHVSYPFVFEDRGEIYLIPESAQAGSAALYRATAFPYRWEKVTTLLDAPALDTTIVMRDGLYWLFTSVAEPAGASPQLVLMYSRALTGPYEFHFDTPVSADARYARCAGRIFEQDGTLIRPAQDASGTYGSSIQFRRVVELSPVSYREEPLTVMRPPDGFRGVHSYDRAGNLEVIDGNRTEPKSRHCAR